MSRSLVVSGLALALALLASCAAISGLSDKEAVECPGGCPDSAAPPRPSSTSTATPDASGPIVDGGGQPDAEPNFVKPDGWELVAVASVAGAGAPPSCPSGFDDASDIGTFPSATGNTCECSCTVTQQATCIGQPIVVTSANASTVCDVTVSGALYNNNPAGGCNGDMTTSVDRTGRYLQVKLDPPSGGACGAPGTTPHPERVQFTDKRRVCDETSRCNGNVCDATVPAPFSACLASQKGSGDDQCPAGFPTKLVAGRANVTCNAAACSCSVAATPCTGTFTFYTDANCTQGAAGVTADDTCRNPNTVGMYMRYKVAATTTTSCTGSGTSAASVTSTETRTVCCR